MQKVLTFNPFDVSEMDRKRGITAVPVPFTVGKATPEEARWTCSRCGEIEPHQLKNKRWIRDRCACQLAEEKARDDEEMARVRDLNLATKTFGWLGSGRSDIALRDKTFDNFSKDLQPEAYRAALKFSLKLEGSLILYGEEFGTGKTHLLAAVCNRIRARNIESHFTTSPKLFKAIQERIQHNDAYTDLIKKAVNVSLLVLDDVDKAKISEFREEIYFEIIDERTKAGRPIAISTNKLDRLGEYVGGAACSRLGIGQTAINMRAGDYRKRL